MFDVLYDFHRRDAESTEINQSISTIARKLEELCTVVGLDFLPPSAD